MTDTLINGGILLMLIVYTISDCRSGVIWWPMAMVAGSIGACMRLFYGVPFLQCMMGMLPGAALLGFCFLSRGSIGSGDCIVIGCIGLLRGAVFAMEIFFAADVFAGIWAIFHIFMKKAGRRTEIAFMPFLLLSYLLFLGMEGFTG